MRGTRGVAPQQSDGRKPLAHVVTGIVTACVSLALAHFLHLGGSGPQGPSGPQGQPGNSATVSNLAVCQNVVANANDQPIFHIYAPARNNGVLSCPQGGTLVPVR